MSKTLFVVDVQNDFVDGSLGCLKCNEIGVYDVIENIRSKIQSDEIDNVIFSCDWHYPNHMSFREYGGEWPTHCIMFTEGASIYGDLIGLSVDKLIDVIYKGLEHESYSAYYGIKMFSGQTPLTTVLRTNILGVYEKNDIVLCGIAGEYCVLETYKDLIHHGFNVEPFWKGIGWVGKENRELYK